MFLVLIDRNRKAQSNIQAVDERQKLESLMRDEKPQSRALSALSDKMEQRRAQREKLKEDAKVLASAKDEVG